MSRRRPINVEIKARNKDESLERMIRRFTKKCKKERIIEKYREKMYYEKPSEKKVKEKHRRKRVMEKLRSKKENIKRKH